MTTAKEPSEMLMGEPSCYTLLSLHKNWRTALKVVGMPGAKTRQMDYF